MPNDKHKSDPSGEHEMLATDIAKTEMTQQDVLLIDEYPEDVATQEIENIEDDVEELVRDAMARTASPPSSPDDPIGYVTNARNAASNTETFTFWSPAENAALGIGSLVRHLVPDPSNAQRKIETYGVITSAEGNTLGLDDFAVHVYEKDGRPPLETILPAPSQRRPIVKYLAKVLGSNQSVRPPILSGPVYPVESAQLATLHGMSQSEWLGTDRMLLGFYQDRKGDFGILAEQRARVLGPKQGHVIMSGLPGAGKTSLFLTLLISLYAQLRDLENKPNEQK